MATPTTGTQKPAGSGLFPPFQTEHYASQLVWLGITFVLLYVLMAKVALPRVGSILTARRATIDSDLAQAQNARSESEAAQAAYEKSLADARNRAQTIAAETRDKYAAEADANRKELEAALNAKLADAERTIAATKASAMSNVREVAVDTAGAIVQRLVGQAPDVAALGQAVDRALKA